MCSRKFYLFSFLLLCIVTNKIYSQTIPDGSKINSFKINIESDTLLNKSFEELKIDFYQIGKDSTVYKTIARYYLIKAKKENNKVKMANAYHLLSKSCEEQNVLKYIDSMIFITKNIKNDYYPALAFVIKGSYYSQKKNYNLALDNYLIAKEITEKKKNLKLLVDIHHNIGLIKNKIGFEREALAIFKKNLLFFSKEKDQDKYLNSYLNTLFAISDTHLRLKEPDSADSYINIGLQKSVKHEMQQYLYSYFLGLNGTKNRMQGNYQKALDTLLKAKTIIDDVNQKINDLQIAKVLFEMKRNKEALFYLKKIDSLTTDKNFSPDESDTYRLLIKHYKSIGDSKNQLKIMNRLISLDSIYREKNKNINSNIIKKYDTAILIEEREDLISNLKEEKIYYYIGIFCLFMLTLISTVITLNYHKKQKIYKKRFHELLNNREEKAVKGEKIKFIEKISDDVDLPKDVVNIILKALNDFENKKEYLNSDINMNIMAKKFETNSSYLSKVINNYKNKNFTNYINDLRIDYCIDKLKNDSKYRKYSIKAIGEEVGFSSPQSFSRAFNKKTGLQPSYFLKQITSLKSKDYKV